MAGRNDWPLPGRLHGHTVVPKHTQLPRWASLRRMGTLGRRIARDSPRRFRWTLGLSSSGPDIGRHGGKVKGPGGFPARRAPSPEWRRLGHRHPLQAFDEICGVDGGQGLTREAGMAAHWWPHHVGHGPANSQPSSQTKSSSIDLPLLPATVSVGKKHHSHAQSPLRCPSYAVFCCMPKYCHAV